MEKIKCCECDISTVHPKNDFFRRYECDDWLLMCFNTDFVYFSNGEMKKGEKYQCILNAPHTPIIHGSSGQSDTGFENDWIYFSGSEVETLIKELDLPINESFYVERENCLTHYISLILKEEKLPMYYSEYYVSGVIHDMLVYIARQRKLFDCRDSSAYESIKSVRKYMIENYAKKYDLNLLANKAGYSVSHFCNLYKKFYDSSPITDLINMRLKKARQLLLFTNYSISEIADLCGFDSIHYFSAIFKKDMGCSPLKYRKSVSVK